MLKENAAAAVAYKELQGAKDNIVKAFKALETKTSSGDVATPDYTTALKKVLH